MNTTSPKGEKLRNPSNTWATAPEYDGVHGRSSAGRVAWLVEEEIVAGGWREGQFFASLDEIARRYAVGRYVASEAARILEIRGGCQLKRGPGGGLVIFSPQLARVALAVATAVRQGGATVRHITEARQALDEEILNQVIEHGDPLVMEALKVRLIGWNDCLEFTVADVLRANYVARFRLAGLTGNPALILFSRCLTMFSIGLSTDLNNPSLLPVLRSYESGLIAALNLGSKRKRRQAADQAIGAGRTIDAEVMQATGPLGRLDASVWLDCAGPDNPRPSRAIQLARQITNDITADKWPQGGRIGSEETLREEYKVGKATLNQAIRMLEEYEMVVSRPGKHKGVYRTPQLSLGPAVRMASNFLAAHHLGERDWCEAMACAEGSSLRLAARAFGEPGIALSRRLSGGAGAEPIGHRSGNEVLDAFRRILEDYKNRAFPALQPSTWDNMFRELPAQNVLPRIDVASGVSSVVTARVILPRISGRG